jgi:hypothetical protein
VLPTEWFRIKSLPAVELLCRIAPVRQDHSLLDRCESGLRQRPELVPWLAGVATARARLDVASRVFAAVADHPGIKQAGLGRRLGSGGRDVQSILYWAERDGRVVRVRSGSTYTLSPPGHSSAPADSS